MKIAGQMRDRWVYTFLSDVVAIYAAYYATLFFRVRSDFGARVFTSVNQMLGIRETGVLGEGFETFYLASAPRIILILVATLCFAYALVGLYDGVRFIRRRPIAWNVIIANTCALLVFYVYFYLRRNAWHPRSFFITFCVINIIFCVSFRSILSRIMRALHSRMPAMRCRALLVGIGEETGFIEGLISAENPHGIYIVGSIRTDAHHNLGMVVSEVERAVREQRADLLILVDKEFSIADIMRLLQVAGELDVPVKVLSDKLDVLMTRARLPVDLIRGVPLVHFEAPTEAQRFLRLRRVIGVASACAALLLLLPLMGLVALLVVVTSPGGPFFVQERIGVNRRPFLMYKFRTMWNRADEMQAQVEEFNESGEGLFKIKRDPRVTPVGRFLRHFSIDELPQLVNVIRGDMTIVGPRPLPRRDFENYYEEWHYSRHAGLPGLTCLWQVSGRSDLDFHNMCILDVYYLRNRNWILDVRILARTVWVVLFAKGAY